MKIIKRDGREVDFNINKIKKAIQSANSEVTRNDKLSQQDIIDITNKVTLTCQQYGRPVTVEEIQNLVEDELMQKNTSVARKYIRFRYQKELDRKQNTTDARILSTVDLENADVLEENSNKNPVIIPTQRDYIAGEVSKDITERYLLPREIVEAHKAGIIHFHDSDYFVQHSHNCCLINLEDMLQNGTVINKTLIEKPHSFATACNIATQIMAQVASSQYGGQTITLSHLAPFVDISRQRIRQEVEQELEFSELKLNEDFSVIDKFITQVTEQRLRKEVERGVQTIQYQINTLMTTNGQTPFVSINMYLNEVEDGRIKDDLAIIIEEVLKQRIQGVKNEKGIWVTPAFPKLLYVLEEDNINEDSKYYYLTKLAAKCTAKRMVPDYISEKIMKQNKINANGEGDCYPCMGCRSFLTPDRTMKLGNVANAKNYIHSIDSSVEFDVEY